MMPVHAALSSAACYQGNADYIMYTNPYIKTKADQDKSVLNSHTQASCRAFR